MIDKAVKENEVRFLFFCLYECIMSTRFYDASDRILLYYYYIYIYIYYIQYVTETQEKTDFFLPVFESRLRTVAAFKIMITNHNPWFFNERGGSSILSRKY